MESIMVEFRRDDTPSWLEVMVDEFTEDPFCHGVLVGADEASVFFITLWAAEMASEVEASLRAMAPGSASFRRMVMSVPELSPSRGFE